MWMRCMGSGREGEHTQQWGRQKSGCNWRLVHQKIVYQIFLDLRKTNDTINQKWVLQLMQKYKIGPNLINYIRSVWNKQSFLLRQSGFFSQPFSVDRGCTQGDTNSPIIFNLIIDAVLRMWKASKEFKETRACFYADDGLLEHTNPELPQEDLNKIVVLFERFDLKTN